MGKGIGTLISKSKAYYYTLGKVYAPLLSQDIVFNRYGWKHLLYDSADHRRNNKDIELRLFLLHEVKGILAKSNNPIITSSKEPYFESKTMYYEFYGKSKRLNRFIKVIVRRLGNGNYHFLVLGDQKEIKIPPKREFYCACFSSVG